MRDFIAVFLAEMEESWGEDFNQEKWDLYFMDSLGTDPVEAARRRADEAELAWRQCIDRQERLTVERLLESILPEIVEQDDIYYVSPAGKRYKLVEVPP